jgi:hypothetical protein
MVLGESLLVPVPVNISQPKTIRKSSKKVLMLKLWSRKSLLPEDRGVVILVLVLPLLELKRQP